MRILLFISFAILVVRKTYSLHIFFIAELDGEEMKLLTWSAKSTKLLTSLRRENEYLFAKGKIRKNVAWQRTAEKFNLISSVKVTGEQCFNKERNQRTSIKKSRTTTAKRVTTGKSATSNKSWKSFSELIRR